MRCDRFPYEVLTNGLQQNTFYFSFSYYIHKSDCVKHPGIESYGIKQ